MSQVKHNERGAAVVEFALIVVMFMSLFIAVLEGGRLFLMQASLASAARDAARVMSIDDDQAAAITRADAAFPFGTLTSSNWDSANSAACPDPSDPAESATVSLTYPTGMITGIWSNTFTLRGTGAMRCNG